MSQKGVDVVIAKTVELQGPVSLEKTRSWIDRIEEAINTVKTRSRYINVPARLRIVLEVNSQGGDVFSVTNFAAKLDFLRQAHPKIEFAANVICAESAAVVFVVICDKGLRTMSYNGQMTIHDFNYNITKGGTEDVKSALESSHVAIYKQILVKHSNLSKEDVKKMTSKETGLTAKKCLKHGLVDVLIGTPPIS